MKVRNLNSSNLDKLSKVFITSHGLALHCRPYSNYECQCKLDIVHRKTYRNCKPVYQCFCHGGEIENCLDVDLDLEEELDGLLKNYM